MNNHPFLKLTTVIGEAAASDRQLPWVFGCICFGIHLS